jgi:Cu2+-exporting ATPase
MKQLCQHCATPYAEDSGIDGFCCAGCRQVYALIQDEGLGDYYRWQDRAAQPLKDRTLSAPDAAALRQIQIQIETVGEAGTSEAVLPVEGMSCMACAWLIERLAANQHGLLGAETSLSGHYVRLQWRRHGEFDLTSYAGDLVRFGYRLEAKQLETNHLSRLSPLMMRCLLSIVFTGNALLLTGFTHFVGEAPLVNLLSLACLSFTLLLGGAPFFLAVYRAGLIRRWHSDWVPVVAIVACLCFLSYTVVAVGWSFSWAAFLASLLVTVLIGSRALSRRHKFPSGG